MSNASADNILILGGTGCGKSELARYLVTLRLASNRYLKPVALDPHKQFVADEAVGLVAVMVSRLRGSPPTLFIIDETSQLAAPERAALVTLFSQARHGGHKVLAIGQRPLMLPLSARSQATEVWAGRLIPDDLKLMADEMGYELEAKTPEQFAFVRLDLKDGVTGPWKLVKGADKKKRLTVGKYRE